MNRRDFLKVISLLPIGVLGAKWTEQEKEVINVKPDTSNNPVGIIDVGPYKGIVVSQNEKGYYIPYHSSASYFVDHTKVKYAYPGDITIKSDGSKWYANEYTVIEDNQYYTIEVDDNNELLS